MTPLEKRKPHFLKTMITESKLTLMEKEILYERDVSECGKAPSVKDDKEVIKTFLCEYSFKL